MAWLAALVTVIVTLVAVGVAGKQLASARLLTRTARHALRESGDARLLALRLSPDVHDAWSTAQRDGSVRARVGAHNLLVLEVEERLARGRGISRVAWRIAAAATVASVLAVARSVPQLGLILAGLGGSASVLSFLLGRMADRETRTARERWNALIRALGGSFTNA